MIWVHLFWKENCRETTGDCANTESFCLLCWLTQESFKIILLFCFSFLFVVVALLFFSAFYLALPCLFFTQRFKGDMQTCKLAWETFFLTCKYLPFLVILHGCPINTYATQAPFYSRVYLWWSLCTLRLHACQVRVTVGDSGLCCCTCVTYFERWLTPLWVVYYFEFKIFGVQTCWFALYWWNAKTGHFMMSQTPVPHNPTWFMIPQAQTATQNDSAQSYFYHFQMLAF